jgi:glycine oxidase
MANVVVIGAGLVGASSAAELRARGHAVTLLERAVPGAEASSAAGGILSPQAECDEDGPLLDLCLKSLVATRALVQQIREETGVDPRLVENGNALLAITEEDRALLAARVKWQRARGLRVEWVREGDEALFPDEGALEAVPYVEGALALARKRGATVRSGVPVETVVVEGGRARGVKLKDGAMLEADVVLVAAGAWSAQVPGARVREGVVFPVRGQIVELDGPPGLLPRVTFFGRAYAIPRFDGKLVIGSTMEPVGFDKRTTEEGIARVRATAEHAIPALKSLPFVRAWAGLRPGTKDGLPLLGESDVQGLLLSTGHFRNGVLLAAESARLIADLVDGKKPGFDLSPFAPQRFA